MAVHRRRKVIKKSKRHSPTVTFHFHRKDLYAGPGYRHPSPPTIPSGIIHPIPAYSIGTNHPFRIRSFYAGPASGSGIIRKHRSQ